MTLATVTPAQLGFPHAATVVAIHSETWDKKTGATAGASRALRSTLRQREIQVLAAFQASLASPQGVRSNLGS